MALIKCKECSNQISDQAAACPHCGIPLLNSPLEINVEKATEQAVSCQKCGSTQLTSNTKGISGVKTLAGLMLMPGGILWGLHGKNKIILTCLKCGNQWQPKPNK